MLTSKREPGLLANDCAVDVLGHAGVCPSVFLLSGIGNNQVPPHQAVVFIWLLHEFDFPVITSPPRGSTTHTMPSTLRFMCYAYCKCAFKQMVGLRKCRKSLSECA